MVDKAKMHRTIFSMLLLVLMGCSSDTDETDSSEQPPKVNIDENKFSETASATDSEGNTYEVGFNQVSSINQDPFVRKINRNGDTVWFVEHEKSEVDGRAVLVTVDEEGTPWVVFTLVGGSYHEEYITQGSFTEANAFSNTYGNSYGNGGGPKVSIIAKLNPETGSIAKGTFVTARKNDGKTNGFTIKSIALTEGQVAFTANTAAWPPGEGSSYERFPNITDADRVDNSFRMYYEMDTDLNQITRAALMDN